MLEILTSLYHALTYTHGAHSALAIAPAIWMALAAAAHGARKNVMEDKPNERDERAYQAETAKWSPWTGMASHFVKKSPDALSAAGQGFITGLSTGQGMFNSNGTLAGAEQKQMTSTDVALYKKLLQEKLANPGNSQLGVNYDFSSLGG